MTPAASLAGRVAVVAGAAHGIDAACARGYAAAGAVVVIADVDTAGGEATAAAICATDHTASFIGCDVGRSAECARLIAQTVRAQGRLDILHDDSGIELCRSIWDTSDADADGDRSVAINLSGSFWCARDAMRVMRNSGKGGVATLSASPHTFLTSREIAADAATKCGRVALKGAPFGIRVNAVLPGATETPMLQRETQASGNAAAMLATFAAAFLASDAASGVTGACIASDGRLMATSNAGAAISYTGESRP